MNGKHWFASPAILAMCLVSPPAASSQMRQIDVHHSVLTVHVYKEGVFSAFGHDHEITAEIAAGSVDTAAKRVEWRANAASLRVRDPKVSDKDRDEVQKNMVGPDVLDVEHFAEIVFRSTSAEPMVPDGWNVSGDLTLHGQTQPVTLQVKAKDGHYLGTAQLKQTAFGIKPIKIAGGAVRVKDEVRIDFDIQLER
jgi:polyisoprenoid-binding protein YceI